MPVLIHAALTYLRTSYNGRRPNTTSCQACRASRKRCSRARPTCSRCATQGKECQTEPSIPRLHHTLEFHNVALVPMLEADNIRDRWLKPQLGFGVNGGAAPTHFHVFTVQYLSCILRSYPSQLQDESQFPPFIHPMQLIRVPASLALANCSSLVRLWMNRAPGSEGMVLATLKNEIDRLVAEQQFISDFDLLCSFQALLIYTLMAHFFPLGEISLIDDNTQTRPDWESWIVASAKRRTLLTMYLFISIYNASKNIPNVMHNELAEVIVPESTALWLARNRNAWVSEYNRHLGSWEDGILTIGELWKAPDTNASSAEKRRGRIERWVMSADEFGMMLFAVTAHLRGC
ncbi:Fungal Zn(2)-Cys(6) binuclear cluster domain-containing protein [Penicillium ucsense]|uniref:Fungal Zn(2)-Cys(6) binuclear cluster domain-containing protein n=1 Tax=Penicillium ucsense TaxID=2839758 RepID=A0A8J8W0U2_9EURO|nr:Fungal Zn(2)-Cys(6) binuclear cluster domain-containing protein [Penicillium ucsense]KAF7733395.1 Fungal Zn(2)-Cys(6) binuclear cluster domain-containing protein [Penicillium ucsense]